MGDVGISRCPPAGISDCSTTSQEEDSMNGKSIGVGRKVWLACGVAALVFVMSAPDAYAAKRVVVLEEFSATW